MSDTTNALLVKSLDSPDERRAPEKTQVGVNHLGEYTIGRIKMEPGWSWSECIKPIVRTESCQLLHVGYCISGKIHVKMSDGEEFEFGAGDVGTIPSGHDAWVVGDEPYVSLDWAGMANYAKPQ